MASCAARRCSNFNALFGEVSKPCSFPINNNRMRFSWQISRQSEIISQSVWKEEPAANIHSIKSIARSNPKEDDKVDIYPYNLSAIKKAQTWIWKFTAMLPHEQKWWKAYSFSVAQARFQDYTKKISILNQFGWSLCQSDVIAVEEAKVDRRRKLWYSYYP